MGGSGTFVAIAIPIFMVFLIVVSFRQAMRSDSKDKEPVESASTNNNASEFGTVSTTPEGNDIEVEEETMPDGTSDAQEYKHCIKCQRAIEADALFCRYCGADQSQASIAAIEGAHCPRCGAKLKNDSVFCQNCGERLTGLRDPESYVLEADTITNQESEIKTVRQVREGENGVKYVQEIHINNGSSNANTPQDDSSAGYAILSFFFPLIGIILWLAWRPTYPKREKSCGNGVLVSIVLSFIAYRYILK